MTSAVKQFFHELGDVLYSTATPFAPVALAVAWLMFIPLVFAFLGTTLPTTPEEQAAWRLRRADPGRIHNQSRLLCKEAATCKKYSGAQLECATAGNFKTCLRIKMGDDAYNYANLCSGGDIGGPVQPLPADTPNALQCFFLTWWQ
jgi:hypothetical protein